MSMLSVDRKRGGMNGLKFDVCLRTSQFKVIFVFMAIFTDIRICNS